MRVMMLHNRYLHRGGEEEVHEAEAAMLRAAGCVVDTVEENNERVSELGRVRSAVNAVWSGATYRRARALFRQQHYDVVHVHNFFPLISPSIYYAAHAEGVPVVQTLHNYRLICPNAIFYRDGKVCESCLGRAVPWPAIRHRCYRGSATASAVVAAMLSIHRASHTWRDKVDIYIALTEFARRKYIEGGLPAQRIVVKPNFVGDDPGPGDGSGGYAVVAGRLVPEKGITTTIEAWKRLGQRIPLKVAGDGPLRKLLQTPEAKASNIEWLGRRSLAETFDILGRASFLLFPPEWYEGFPRVIGEAFAKGTPVVAANLGGAGELIEPGRTGLHYRAGDIDDMVTKVTWLLDNPAALAAMRDGARKEFELKYTAGQNVRRLMDIYRRAITDHRARTRLLRQPAPVQTHRPAIAPGAPADIGNAHTKDY